MKKTLALFILSFMIISCEKELDVKLIPKNPLLVVNCSIVADSTWLISLTRTGNILDYTGTIPKVNDAEIIILNEKKEPLEKLEYFSSTPSTPTTPNARDDINNYRGKTTPVAGQTYSIQVNVNGESSLYATNKIPFPVAISSAEINSGELQIKFQDPAIEKNYYRIRIYVEYLYVPSAIKNGVLIPDSSKAYIAKSYLPYTSEGLTDELDGNSLIADDLFNGKIYELRLKIQNPYFNRPQQKLHIILLSLSKEYYDYWSSLKLAKKTDDNPYLAQPVQIYSNIENGLGIFAGYSASEILLK